MQNMNPTITHLLAEADGRSTFASIEVPTQAVDFAPPAPKINISAPYETTRTVLLVVPPHWYGEAHPAPNRQLMTIVQGRLEVTASGGVTRVFEAGDTALVEDTTGEGHATRNLSDKPTILSVSQF